MTRRRHSMPYGAELRDDGSVRFALWAPGAQRIDLVLAERSGGARALPMRAAAEGWFELTTDAARAGSRYRYRVDGGLEVPDPASRCNPEDVHGPSEVLDPAAFEWTDGEWRGRPWNEAVIYELHVGTFSPEGTFAGLEKRLDYLADLGVTALEIMPVAEFPGRRGWGYDGVLPFAPESSYGRPEELKALVVAAHRRGLAVLLDVVYNHFGPEGNYLHAYAPQFFTDRHATPWGAAINFDGEASRWVREFFIHNALYWLEEYHLDGLRFDAVHAIIDDSPTHVLTELAARLRTGPGAQRPVHLILENNLNQARFLGPPGARDTFDAQWNDDEHHCLHVLLTGERDGYYEDYAEPNALLARCLAEGFAYQGEPSAHEGKPRGEPSAHLPPSAFVPFLQNHDQIGNRAYGERLAHLVEEDAPLLAAATLLLLAPQPPLLFMGEEWAAPEPFPYFCDFGPELAQAVREGRRREFARFERFRDDAVWATVPDAVSPETFESARLHWENPTKPRHARWLETYRRLLAVRKQEIAPLVPRLGNGRSFPLGASGAFRVAWAAREGATLVLLANLTAAAVPLDARPAGREIHSTHPTDAQGMPRTELPAWSVTWLLSTSQVH